MYFKAIVMKTRLLSPVRASVLMALCCAAAARVEAGVVIFNFGSDGYVLGADATLQGNTFVSLSGSDKYGEPHGCLGPD